jgi:uncharacterized protein YcbX
MNVPAEGRGSVVTAEAGAAPLRLARIRAYPLKGAGGFDLSEARLDSLGIPGDRRWMLVKETGHFLSQRTHPRLALLRVEPGKDSGDPLGFQVSVPGREPFVLAPEDAGGVWREARLHGEGVKGLEVSEGTDWFSDFLGEPCRLLFFPLDAHRPVDPTFAAGHRTGFSDGYPLHLTTVESLVDLNQRLPDPVDMLRFRPNLVITGGTPWEEDRWRVLEVASVRLHLVKPCARCTVTTVDQGSGQGGKEPLRSLGGFRGWEGKAYFGQNVVFEGAGSFRVGETVRILEKGEARPPLPRQERWDQGVPG